MGSSSGQGGGGGGFDLSFKILLIGDAGVGKSSLLVSFISSSVEDLAPTIGILYSYLASLVLMFLLVSFLFTVLWILSLQATSNVFGSFLS